MGKWMVTVVGILTLWAAPRVWAQPLGVGDPAPAIQVKEFVKGAPVSSLEKGKRYVVEFWATWCGPCRVSIPHLTELQKKHPEVTFIGVSVWEQDQKGVRPFVQQMGDKMAYTVAMDDVPEGARGNEGKMAKSWMEAAGQDGIPTAFLIDRDTRIAWIGHPMGLDEPLEKVAAGTWDVAAARTQFQKDQARRGKMRELQEKLTKAQQSGDPHQMLAALDQAIAEDPAMEAPLGLQRYFVLSRGIKDPEQAEVYGSHLVDSVLKDNAAALNELAWSIVAPEAPKANASAVKLALKAAQRADELAQGKDPGIADTLARAYFEAGSPAKALAAQERAVRLAKGTPVENDPGVKQRLEQYRKAIKPH
jgi:thiol-disulfide isomerase/thioredoxin